MTVSVYVKISRAVEMQHSLIIRADLHMNFKFFIHLTRQGSSPVEIMDRVVAVLCDALVVFANSLKWWAHSTECLL